VTLVIESFFCTYLGSKKAALIYIFIITKEREERASRIKTNQIKSNQIKSIIVIIMSETIDTPQTPVHSSTAAAGEPQTPLSDPTIVSSLEDHDNHHPVVIQNESNDGHYPELLQSLDVDERVPTDTVSSSSPPRQVWSDVLSKPATTPSDSSTQGNPLLVRPTVVTPDATAARRNEEAVRRNLMFQGGNPAAPPPRRGTWGNRNPFTDDEDSGKFKKHTATVATGRFSFSFFSRFCHAMPCNAMQY
jgi:hypothetical protein